MVLMGFMGAGKTTVGQSLAGMLNCRFIDTDQWIEREQGRKISEIFETEGEKAFRDMETSLLKELQSDREDLVLSIGGGMPVREENRVLLRKIGTVIYLKTSKEEIIRRVSGDNGRPLLQGGTLEQKVASLMEGREVIYLETAHEKILTDGKTPEEIAKEIIKIAGK